jgi:hypothetical protein
MLGFPYPRFEALLLALFDAEMRPLLAALSRRLTDITSLTVSAPTTSKVQIEKRRRAHHEREVELEDLIGDERKESRIRIRELLGEIRDLKR